MGENEDEWDEDATWEWQRREDERALTPAGIAEQNRYLLRRYGFFRRSADCVADALRQRPEVVAITLVGPLARDPFKEVPRFSPYRRREIELWHECGHFDLAIWLTDFGDLDGLRRAKNRALLDMKSENEGGVAAHQASALLFEPGTDRYRGWLCQYNTCPKHKPACLVPGCGNVKFLQQFYDFEPEPDMFAENRSVRLFDRATNLVRRAVALPVQPDEDDPSG